MMGGMDEFTADNRDPNVAHDQVLAAARAHYGDRGFDVVDSVVVKRAMQYRATIHTQGKDAD